MTWKIVHFDLVGTLCDFPLAAFDALMAEMPARLGITPQAFAAPWSEAYREQEEGTAPIDETVRRLVVRASGIVDSQRIRAAVHAWHRFQDQVLVPRPDAISTLSDLKDRGYQLGLIANQPPAIAKQWPSTGLARWFDTAVFSCDVRVRKPDPRIYAIACDRLDVRPEDCVFVGDGGSRELSGATHLGMRAIRIRVPDEPAELEQRLGREPWNGETIPSLSAVLACVP